MSRNPAFKASIVTPTFNAASYIDACVRNVVEQGDVVVEHIIADGGSTDGTVERVRELMKTVPHLRFIPGPDRGQSDAMNKATAMATGDVVSVLNADDFYQPEAVARGVAVLATMKGPAMVVGDCEIIDLDGRRVHFNRPTDMRLESLLCDSYLLPFPANPSAYFYSRAVHDLVGGYDVDDHYAMDADFILKCLAKVEVRYVPGHWGNFRLIPGAKTHDDDSSAARLTALIERHKRLLTDAQRRRMERIWRLRLQKVRTDAFIGKVRSRLGRLLHGRR